MKAIKTFDTSSNRVLLAEFDKNWERETTSAGLIVYTAAANDAEVKLLLAGGQTQTLVFRKRKTIIVAGSTFHFSPHSYFITS
ncbi:hypothetical protein [Bacillus sp. MUM 13]|uniref:hypothetical protein n=1 Tax=Bacillus sp. MUM 13 TaxID=1678001 RepID=UPI0008F59435|nr:hypothetical protein [Bacillus sp. MUM 13]OIK13350.1 hypothetical protein BIV59_06220 [Bacillus sp. MUM 13]